MLDDYMEINNVCVCLLLHWNHCSQWHDVLCTCGQCHTFWLLPMNAMHFVCSLFHIGLMICQAMPSIFHDTMVLSTSGAWCEKIHTKPNETKQNENTLNYSSIFFRSFEINFNEELIKFISNVNDFDEIRKLRYNYE